MKLTIIHNEERKTDVLLENSEGFTVSDILGIIELAKFQIIAAQSVVPTEENENDS